MTRITRLAFGLAATAAAALVTLATASPALACGGFFCSNLPMDQAGERIAFGIDGTTVTAYINIQYTGEADDFGWVIPVQSQPSEIEVGTQDLFQQLGWRTAPRYELTWDNEDGDDCGFWTRALEDDEVFASDPGDGGVDVLDSRDVGPYNAVVLAATDATALVDWLNENGFVQPETSTPLIQHYLDLEMIFVAVKLQANAASGDVVPLVLTFEEENPCIPLVLTKVAAISDMPVLAYVFADARAVPTNWLEVEVNEKRIDWLNWGANYADLLNQAVDEASGRAFVTEYAGTHELGDALWVDGQLDTSELRETTDPARFVELMLQSGFPRTPIVQTLIRTHIAMPQELIDMGIDEAAFYNNLGEYADLLEGMDFDPIAFADDIEERIIQPLKDAQAFVDRYPYLTRIYTTVSPEEMTRDPLFAINRDAPDKSNVHTASGAGTCDENGDFLTITLTLESGESYVLEGPFEDIWSGGYLEGALPGEPAASVISLWGSAGAAAQVSAGEVAAIDARLDTEAPDSILDDLGAGTVGPTTPTTPTNSTDPSGCAGGDGGPGTLLVLLGAALVAMRRRRRKAA